MLFVCFFEGTLGTSVFFFLTKRGSKELEHKCENVDLKTQSLVSMRNKRLAARGGKMETKRDSSRRCAHYSGATRRDKMTQVMPTACMGEGVEAHASTVGNKQKVFPTCFLFTSRGAPLSSLHESERRAVNAALVSLALCAARSGLHSSTRPQRRSRACICGFVRLVTHLVFFFL